MTRWIHELQRLENQIGKGTPKEPLKSTETSNGKPIYYWITDPEEKDYRVSDCDLCQVGRCIRRIESCEAWDHHVVIHRYQGDQS